MRSIIVCTCSDAADMREELAKLTAAGKNRDEIIQHFVQKYGSQEVLAQPIDKGFNRLAWSVPYGVGIAGVLLIGGMAIRWSRRRHQTAAAVSEPIPSNRVLEEKLDDELRDLD